MKLLFKNDGFSKDFKELLGFVDADMNFRNIRAELRSATRELTNIIGRPFYNQVVEWYNDENDAEEYKNLIEYVRYAIALNAYRIFSPSNDLKHSNNGRLMRVNENEKQPFEWMIERDNKNQELKYYRAVDDLLDYLEEENIDEWITSDAYAETKKHFITSTADFEAFFPIESRLLLMKLMPSFSKCEREHFIPLMGSTAFELFKTYPSTNPELLMLFKEATVYYALSWGIRRLSAQLFPEGVLQQYVSDRMIKPKKLPTKMEAQLVAQEFDKDLNKVLIEIGELIWKNKSKDDEDPEPLDFGFDCDSNYVIT